MEVLLLGCGLFILTHSIPFSVTLRDRLIGAIGRRAYIISFIASSFAIIYLIVMGYQAAPYIAIYDPPTWGRHATMLALLISIILMVASMRQSIVRKIAPYPRTTAIALWALAHCLIRGDGASIILFGTFIVYSMMAIGVAKARGKAYQYSAQSITYEAVSLGLAGLIYGGLIFLHPIIIGIAVF